MKVNKLVLLMALFNFTVWSLYFHNEVTAFFPMADANAEDPHLNRRQGKAFKNARIVMGMGEEVRIDLVELFELKSSDNGYRTIMYRRETIKGFLKPEGEDNDTIFLAECYKDDTFEFVLIDENGEKETLLVDVYLNETYEEFDRKKRSKRYPLRSQPGFKNHRLLTKL
jgi:hypothetical protein